MFTDQKVEKPCPFSSPRISPFLFWEQRHDGIGSKCHVSHTHPQRDMKCSCVLSAFNVPLYEPSKTLHKGTVPVKSLGLNTDPHDTF